MNAFVRVEVHPCPQKKLRPLFELAENSWEKLDFCLAADRVLVALQGTTAIC